MKAGIFKTFIVLLFVQCVYDSNAQGYKVIVNKSNAVNTISKKGVSDLFLKKAKWEDGSSVMPVDMVSGTKVRDEFSRQIHGKSTTAIRSFWQQAVFSGTASAPPELATDTEIIEYIKQNEGAIGYVSGSANTEGVKIITVN